MAEFPEKDTVNPTGLESSSPLSREGGIPEWITSYLDGEVSGAEAEKARKCIQGSPEIRREAQDIQRAWDLLDFLPVTESSVAKALETHELVLRNSNSQPVVLEDTDPQLEPIDLLADLESGGSNQANHRIVLTGTGAFWRRSLIPAAIGGCFGFLALGGWRFLETRHREKMRQGFGIVVNVQILRDAGDIDFLKAIAVPELFGPPESGVAQ